MDQFDIAQRFLRCMPLKDALKARLVCRGWRDAFALHFTQFDEFWRKNQRAVDGCISGMRCTEVFNGQQRTCIMHLCFRDPQVRQRNANFTPQQFANREAQSLSKVMRMLALVLSPKITSPARSDMEVLGVNFTGGWGWTYEILIKRTGTNEVTNKLSP